MVEIVVPTIGIIAYYENWKRSFSEKQKKLLTFPILDATNKICQLLNFPFQRYVAAIILTESYGKESIIGSSGEIGIMQIMPSTFRSLDRIYHFNFTENDLYAMKPNIYVGVTLLKHNINILGDIFDAIMSYNVGIDLKPYDKAKNYLNKVIENAK